jgi:hypothetical protein
MRLLGFEVLGFEVLGFEVIAEACGLMPPREGQPFCKPL